MKPLLVGLNNPISNDPADALVPWPVGCTGDRLLGIIQAARPKFEMVDYLHAFDRINLWGGRKLPSGARGARMLANEGTRLLRRLEGGPPRDVVLLGVKVWAAVMTRHAHATTLALPFFSSREVGAVRCWYFAHPSGRCFVYNEPGRKQRAAEILVSIIEGGQ